MPDSSTLDSILLRFLVKKQKIVKGTALNCLCFIVLF